MTTNLPSPEQMLSDTASQPDDQSLSYPKTSAAIQASSNPKPPDYSAGHQTAAEIGVSEKNDKTGMDARTKISNLLKDKEQEWTAVVERKGPLRLLDLPMDVLKEIVKEVSFPPQQSCISIHTDSRFEVTHTNDLTALALTHSALHNLAIPHIYSRFDIVWPDAHATTDPRTGVDALTYGLATLCMGDVFTDHTKKQTIACTNCGTTNIAGCHHGFQVALKPGDRRLGNQYPQFTRKFSLGNGPADWVQEYLITKESGKMLGTLVALAVARMINLETFVWDMPTGVLRDVWLALSSLQSRSPNNECRLERVWVRWHDNSDPSNMSSNQGPNSTAPTTTSQMLAGSTMSSVGWTIPSGSNSASQHTHSISYAQSRVEYPTLSVLPPLKSLSVLDIDELEYLEEMSMLIARSKDRLRELRVGIAGKAISRDFAFAWDGPDLHQVDHEAKWPGASGIGERRLGGVLGVLLGRVYDIRKRTKTRSTNERDHNVQSNSIMASNIPIPTEEALEVVTTGGEHQTPIGDTHIHVAHESEQAYDTIDHEQGAIQISENSVSVSSGGAASAGAHAGVLAVGSTEQSADHGLEQQSLPSNGQNIQSDADSLTTLISAHQSVSDPAIVMEQQSSYPAIQANTPTRRSQSLGRKASVLNDIPSIGRERLEGKLRLQTLELERVALSVAVLQKAFDWSVLTNLTILDCPQHDRLWTMLRRHFQPTTLGASHQTSKHSPTLQYHLNLRKVHTDAASSALIAFLKETLAPNTLETLFLQDRRRSGNTSITIVRILFAV